MLNHELLGRTAGSIVRLAENLSLGDAEAIADYPVRAARLLPDLASDVVTGNDGTILTKIYDVAFLVVAEVIPLCRRTIRMRALQMVQDRAQLNAST